MKDTERDQKIILSYNERSHPWELRYQDGWATDNTNSAEAPVLPEWMRHWQH
jgi:hypothetical protein